MAGEITDGLTATVYSIEVAHTQFMVETRQHGDMQNCWCWNEELERDRKWLTSRAWVIKPWILQRLTDKDHL